MLISKTGWRIALGLSLLSSLAPISASGAEKVVVTYGGFGRSLQVSELENFANSAPPSPTLKFLLKAVGQNPDQARAFLKQDVPINAQTLDELTHLLPGEFLLLQVGQILHTPERLANVEALRSALILSTVDDQQISVLEFLRKYPTQAVYIDSRQLTKTTRGISGFIRTAEAGVKQHLGEASEVLGRLLCDCRRADSDP